MGSLFKSKRSIKTIFFDIGGVVVRAPMEGYLSLGMEIFSCSKDELNRATAIALPGLETGKTTSEEFWNRVSSHISSQNHTELVPAWRFKGFWEGLMTDSLKIDSEVLDLVRRLKAHVRIAAFSNVIKEHAFILQREKVYAHFNPVILSCEVGYRKPDRESFLKAAKLTKTPPDRCMLIDDDSRNVEAAQSVGYRGHLYTDLSDLQREIYQMGLLK